MAGGDRRLERRLDDPCEALSMAEPLARLAVRLVLVTMDQREEEPAIPEVRQHPVDDAPDLRRGRIIGADGALERHAQLLDPLEHHGEVERLLAREVPVHGPLADAARLDDVVHLHLVVVAAREDGLRGMEYLVPQTGRRRTAAADGKRAAGGG